MPSLFERQHTWFLGIVLRFKDFDPPSTMVKLCGFWQDFGSPDHKAGIGNVGYLHQRELERHGLGQY